MGQYPSMHHDCSVTSRLFADLWMAYSIEPLEEDAVVPSNPNTDLQDDESRVLAAVPQGVTPVGNWDSLGDEDTKRIIASGGVLKRGTRYSLTCRDVERISSARSFRFV